MAFENVFGNVRFDIPVNQANQNAQQLQSMIGQGIAMAQRKEEMDMKRRQMEMKQQDVDLSKMAQRELLKRQAGLPYDENAIRAYSDFKGSQTYIDPITQQVIRQPSLVDRIGMGKQQVQTPAQNMGFDVPMSAPAPAPQMPQGFADIAGDGSYNIKDESSLPPIQDVLPPVAGLEGQPLIDPNAYKAGGILAGTRAGALKEEESRQKMTEQFIAEKMKRSMQGLERFNEGQLSAANFANRMVENSNILDALEEKHGGAKTGFAGAAEAVISAIPSMGITDKLGKGIVKMAATPQEQQYLNAAQNWIRANLRKESGAVIGDQEMIDEYSTYFPTAGDSPEVIEQKRKARKETEKGMVAQSAGAYQEAFGKKQQSSQPTSFNSVQEAEAANLPVGTEIIINGRRAIVR